VNAFGKLAGWVALLAAAGAAQAAGVVGQSGVRSGALPAVPAMASATPTVELIAGRVGAVDASRGTLTVSGQRLALHPSRLRVFGPGGGRATAAQIRPGMRILFALEAGTAGERKVVLVYLDSSS